MKNIIIVFAVIASTTGAYAQSDSTNKKWNQSENKTYSDAQSQRYADGYLFQNGKLVAVKDGKITRLEKDATLANGTIIMSDGNYLKKGGTKVKFKEGEHMDLTGKLVSNSKPSLHQDVSDQNYPDGYLFQNGKVMLVQNGRLTPIDKDVTLSNGTVITGNGSYTRKGSARLQFKEGEHIDMSGKVVHKNNFKSLGNHDKSDKKKDMYLLNDSTQQQRD